jgi:anti-sigma-K factor RskA/putative zinc finger protein
MSAAHDCGGDAAAYVLGALEPDEAEAFRRHLAGCVVCRDEVTAFQQVADALPMAAPHHAAPRRLRRRVLGAVRAEPQAGSQAAPLRPLRRVGPLPRPAFAVGALLVAALAIAGGIVISSPGSSGSRVIQASVIGLPGSAELRVAGGRADLVVNHMPPPPAGHIYEVWFKRGPRPPSPTSTLFSVTSSGAGDVGLTGTLHGVSEVLVTPEPAGGSLVPTHTPVIVAQLT